MSRSECQPRDGTQRLAGSARLSALPLAALPTGGSIGASLPTFHVKAADRARVAYMPGTAWPVTGFPPDSSWNLVLAPVLMPSETSFDTSTAIRLRSPYRFPPDASYDAFSSSLTTTVFSQCSMRWFDTTPRRATPKGHNLHLPRSSTSIEVSYLHPNLSLSARGAHTILVLSGMQPQPDFLHPLGERGQHLTCLPLGRAVHHRVVRVALELHGRELALQPRYRTRSA